jgi:hypothetical protein
VRQTQEDEPLMVAPIGPLMVASMVWVRFEASTRDWTGN